MKNEGDVDNDMLKTDLGVRKPSVILDKDAENARVIIYMHASALSDVKVEGCRGTRYVVDPAGKIALVKR